MSSKLLSLSFEATYYLYRKPVRMSFSFDRLAAIIRSELNKDVVSGDVFIFMNRTRSMMKILIYENGGFSIFYRRLDEGSFPLPLINTDQIISYRMTHDQMVTMLSGMIPESGGTVKAPRYEPLHGAVGSMQ